MERDMDKVLEDREADLNEEEDLVLARVNNSMTD